MNSLSETHPIWLTMHTMSITKTSKLLLNNNIQINLNDFSSPYFMTSIPLIKILDISNNEITSLEGLPYLPHLSTFIADDTNISSFLNFKSIKHATKVSFKRTHISKLVNYRMAILLICGKKLISIDGKKIPTSLFEKISHYPKYTSELINRGWMVEYPCPPDNIIDELCITYGIQSASASTSVSSISNEVTFDKIYNEYKSRQQAMFNIAEPIFQIEEKRDIEEELSVAIRQLFYEHGININSTDDNCQEKLLFEVEELCKKAFDKKLLLQTLVEHIKTTKVKTKRKSKSDFIP
ncbi:hypothetical protein TRFO_27421 [Tritrichomonas foetus]|uniref:Leucine Rich Repeat family protein n=1 Tax=Tritrichomonas foetus TaxID=1144522 RepID=A0A1J4K0S4_9EUKA|nr:hypothetical protein TRFO_27421 [Tritrichomonas foetus]|eukprot:OHT04975.1 hypothetical protein TRFO_27421 [Tritrichomonas foetus]